MSDTLYIHVVCPVCASSENSCPEETSVTSTPASKVVTTTTHSMTTHSATVLPKFTLGNHGVNWAFFQNMGVGVTDRSVSDPPHNHTGRSSPIKDDGFPGAA